MQFYVWYDHFLEEHFSFEKNELDTVFFKLKSQLESEKVIFHVVEAESMNDAYNIYRMSLKNSNNDIPDEDEETIPGSLPLTNSVKPHFH